MKYQWFRHFKVLLLTPLVIVFLFAMGCGGSASPEAAPAAEPKMDAAPKTETMEKKDTAAAETMKKESTEAAAPKTEAKAAPTAALDFATPAAVAAPVVSRPWKEWSDQGKYGGTLPMAVVYELSHWDTMQACCNRALYNARDLYSTLVMQDHRDQTTIIGDLAESWEWSPDGMSLIFRLHDANWTDGQPVTADDVVFSLDRMVMEGVARPRVRNLTPYYAGSEAVDAKTVKLNTKFTTPNALIPFLAIDYMIMMPKHVLEGREDSETYFDTPSNIVGSGAYKFVSHERGSLIEMEKNPDYFKDGLPFIDKIESFVISDRSRVLTALQTEQIWLTPGTGMSDQDALDFNELFKDKGKAWLKGANGMRFFQFNFNNPPVDDPRVRRAVHLAVDRQEINIIRRLGNGKLGVPFYPNTWMSATDEEIASWPGFRYVDGAGTPLTTGPYEVPDAQKDPRDIEMAKELLAEAGFPDGVTLQFHTYNLIQDVAVILKEQLAKAGITLELKITDTTTGFNAEQSGDYEHMLMLGHGPNINDPDDLFIGIYLPGGPRNALKYEDPRIREIFEEQKSETDEVKRRELIKEAEDILRQGEGHFVHLIWIASYSFVVNHSRVQNFLQVPLGSQYGFQKEHLWIEQ